MSLRAPFPYFGGKAQIAPEVWTRLGSVANYVEPFAGSLAVLLARPGSGPFGTETINDADGFVVNFWRAVSSDPEEVAYYADWPCTELDIQARHAYLVKRIPWLVDRLGGDPSFCDPKLAGWWVWGACSWIGSGWCSGEGPWEERDGVLVNTRTEGIERARGVALQLPHLSAGQGVNRKLPHLGDAGQGINKRRSLSDQGNAVCAWLVALQERMRGVRMPCGDWRRVLTPVVTHRHGLTGIFLDPPYTDGEMSYAGGSCNSQEVASWCAENGEHPLLRIALCGHEGDYELPGWSALHWKARGGYGNAGGEDADDNRHRETIWFSPACLGAAQPSLFEEPT